MIIVFDKDTGLIERMSGGSVKELPELKDNQDIIEYDKSVNHETHKVNPATGKIVKRKKETIPAHVKSDIELKFDETRAILDKIDNDFDMSFEDVDSFVDSMVDNKPLLKALLKFMLANTKTMKQGYSKARKIK